MTSGNDVRLLFLRDGGQSADVVAEALEAFCLPATRSLDIAIYDCGFVGEVADRIRAMLQARAAQGVQIRIAYYGGEHPMPNIPPPLGSSAGFLASLQLPLRSVTGYQALMHHKYVVRDAGESNSAVWTGSTNWTGDAWTREENVVITLPSPALASRYAADFADLWATGRVEKSGRGDGGDAQVQVDGRPVQARVWFSPPDGEDMPRAVARDLQAARERIVIASPVLTSGSIVAALHQVVQSGAVPLRGVYDATQMHQVNGQWAGEPTAHWKIDAVREIFGGGTFSGKHSTPYAPGAVHDYMHVKAIVADDVVYLGSYNFSRSGEENAENLLRLESRTLADACVDFINSLIDRYRAA